MCEQVKSIYADYITLFEGEQYTTAAINRRLPIPVAGMVTDLFEELALIDDVQGIVWDSEEGRIAMTPYWCEAGHANKLDLEDLAEKAIAKAIEVLEEERIDDPVEAFEHLASVCWRDVNETRECDVELEVLLNCQAHAYWAEYTLRQTLNGQLAQDVNAELLAALKVAEHALGNAVADAHTIGEVEADKDGYHGQARKSHIREVVSCYEEPRALVQAAIAKVEGK